uniref:RRM domain-containing protein n=1 Tax=Tetraodon nigroviridis TaxID=99883 RepID=H3CQX5_TETNG
MKSTENMKIRKRDIRAEFCQKQKSDLGEELTKTLIVTGLNDKTTAETLRDAFEGAVSARVMTNKTKVSSRFGFVEFESDEVCQKAKKTMEDCQIDGNKVIVAFARTKVQRKPSAAARDSAEDQAAEQNVADRALTEDVAGPVSDADPSEGAAPVL